MKDLRKILQKGLLLIGLLAALNWVYEYWLFKGDLKEHSETGKLLWEARDTFEILYLGESSDLTTGDEDVEKRTITQFLQQYYPAKPIGTVAKGALHAGNYYDILCNIPSTSTLKTVVVTVNLRSFDAGWIHSKLETALQKEMVLLKPGPPLWRRFLLSLHDYETKTAEERRADVQAQWRRDTLHFPKPFPYTTVEAWDSAVAMGYDRITSGLPPRSTYEAGMAAHYVKNFAFQIDPETHPRMRDLDRIVALAQERGWNLVLNLLPENISQAEQFVGPELAGLMRQNRDLLMARYGKLAGVTFVDQLESLPSEDFIDKDFTTEHYFEHGRHSVAERLAHALAPLLPGQMQVPKNPRARAMRSFYNDCEGKEIWSQMQTLDTKHAHSGRQASLIQAPQAKFGITFARSVAALDTTAIDSMEVSCWVYTEAADPQASIAWEAGGAQTGYHWDEYKLNLLKIPAGQWTEVSFKKALWPDLAKSEIFKAYPYNTSTTMVWIDDIRIVFAGK